MNGDPIYREAISVRRWMRHRNEGALSTLSTRHEGHPFGSSISFVCDRIGCPIFLVSSIAEHSANMDFDPRVSLLTQDMQRHPGVQFGSARLTIIGHAERFDPSSAEHDRFLRYLPQASELISLGDFSFRRIRPLALRFIGGFGNAGWIDPEDYLYDDLITLSPPGSLEPDVLKDLRVLCDLPARQEPESGVDTPVGVTLVGIDSDGFDIRDGGCLRRFDFPQAAASEDHAMNMIRAMAAARLLHSGQG